MKITPRQIADHLKQLLKETLNIDVIHNGGNSTMQNLSHNKFAIAIINDEVNIVFLDKRSTYSIKRSIKDPKSLTYPIEAVKKIINGESLVNHPDAEFLNNIDEEAFMIVTGKQY